MSRFGDDYEEDFPNSGVLWWANVERQFSGKKGRAMLVEMERALLAMPEPRLVHGVLCDGDGVCAVGAAIVERRVTQGEDRAVVMADLAKRYGSCYCMHTKAEHGLEGGSCRPCFGKPFPCHGYEPEEGSAWETADAAKEVGFPWLAAYRIEYHNDEEERSDITPELRWERTLAWVRAEMARPVSGTSPKMS